MIELFKIIKYMYTFCFMELSENSIKTGGNDYKFVKHHCRDDLRKFSVTNWVIPIWNSLSNHVVSANTVYTFKNRLDNYWSDRGVLYNY